MSSAGSSWQNALDSLLANPWLWGGVLTLLGLAVALTALLAWILTQGLRRKALGLETELRLREQAHTQQLETLQDAKDQLSDAFAAVANRALQANNQQFLQLAEQQFKGLQGQASTDLSARQQAIGQLLEPLNESLTQTRGLLREIETKREHNAGALDEHLRQLAGSQQRLQAETQQLSKALRQPNVRGRWGELSLQRVVELAGMVEHVDFDVQVHLATDAGALRPDMLVHLPAGRQLVLDAKTPLNAYLDALEATSEQTRKQALQLHSRHVRQRIRELSSKTYWQQFENTPDFVVLYVPGEAFLNAAMDVDHSLLESALQQKVVLASPTSLMALLRVIAYGWREQAVTENARKIQQLGAQLHQRLTVFTAHLANVGQNLGNAVDHYNNAVGSLDRMVLPAARKMSDFGVAEDEIQPPSELEQQARSVRDGNA